MVNVGKPKNISSFLTSNWIRDLTDLGAFSSYMQCMYYLKKTCTLNMLWLFFVFPELIRIVINLLLTILHSLCISIISASKYFCFLYNDHIKQALYRCYVDIGVTTILGQTIDYSLFSGFRITVSISSWLFFFVGY